MGLSVAYGYCTNLTEKERFDIDKQVEENLKFLLGRKIIKIRFRKKKVFLTLKDRLNSHKIKIVLPVVLFFTILLSYPTDTKAVGLPNPVRSAPYIQRLYPQGTSGQGSVLSTAPIISPRVDKIRFRRVPELPLCIYVMDKNFLVRPEIRKIIKELRAGDLTSAFVGNTIFLLVMYGIWIMASGSDGFIQQPNAGWGVNRNPFQPPTAEHRYPPILNVLDPRRSSPSDRCGSVLQEGRMNEMCPNQRDKNGFVMSYEEAYKLVAETYTGYIEVNEDCKITEWQGAKHIYHAKGMGVEPTDYGFTQKELERIRGEEVYKGGGLIAYARRGYRLPPVEMVRAYSEKLKESCKQASIRATKVPFYDANGKWSTTVYLIPPLEGEKRGIMIVFNESTKDLITGDKQRQKAFTRLEEEGFIGSPKWMRKWNNSTIGPTPAPACEFSSLAE